MQYKRTNKAIDQIGHELGVDYILEGSVRRALDRVRITAQLIKVFDQTHLWTEVYDREVKDVLAIQSEVATCVRRSLTGEVFSAHPVESSRMYSTGSAAYEAYLKGRYFWSRRHEGGLRKAIGCFEYSIEHDPTFALAYSGLADCYALLSWYGESPPKDAGPLARSAAKKAVELDETLGEAHASLGLILFWYEWDWSGAESEFRRAIQLNPNYATGHQWFASYLLAMGSFEEALSELTRAQALDPLCLIIVQSMGDPLFYSRRYDQAIEQYRKTIEMNPAFAPAHFSLGRAYEQKGMHQDAVAEFQQANALSGKMEALPALAHALGMLGNRTEAERILQEITRRSRTNYVPPLAIALIHLGLAQYDFALELLHKALHERSCWLAYVKVDPLYDPIRPDPKFQDLLRKLRLESPHSLAV
jgi:tetratricopeptide (TPR) repeat protein